MDFVRFEIIDVETKYFEVLRNCFYKEENGIFYKDFPADYKYIEQVKKNFVNNGEKMINQLAYFNKIPWDSALEYFCMSAEKYSVDWWLTGSCAACIR